jgi:acyl carrier protein
MINKRIKYVLEIISKNTGIKKNLINEKSIMSDFSKWDSIAQVKIMIELENKIKKKISTSKISELDSVKKILLFLKK